MGSVLSRHPGEPLFVPAVHDGYKVGADMAVSLEFRTSQSEGVVLGISSAKVDAVGLEMVDGQVSPSG